MKRIHWRVTALAGILTLSLALTAVFTQGRTAAESKTEQKEEQLQTEEVTEQGAEVAQEEKQDDYGGLDPDAVVLTVGKDAVPLRKAYFLVKFQQAVVQSVYGEEWSTFLGDGDFEGFQEDMKGTIMNLLIRMSLARQYREEYGITLTKEENEKINETVDAFMKSNSDAAQKAMMANEAILTEILEDYTLLSKMTEAITYSTSVEYEKCKTYAYVYASFGEDAGSPLDDVNESTETILENYESIYNRVSSGEDFYTVASEMGYPVALHTYFPEDDGDAMQEMNQMMNSLKTGEVSKVQYVGDNQGVFIGQVEETDEEDLESAKESYLKREKAKVLKKQIQDWIKENEPVIEQELWDQVNLEESIKAYTIQTES